MTAPFEYAPGNPIPSFLVYHAIADGDVAAIYRERGGSAVCSLWQRVAEGKRRG